MPSFPLRSHVLAVLATASLLVACATPGPGDAGTSRLTVRTTGTIVSIDTAPWAYDGHAVVRLESADGRLAVLLPARWNLCQATPVDVEALGPGMRVEVVGEQDPEGGVVVCADASHRLQPLPPGE